MKTKLNDKPKQKMHSPFQTENLSSILKFITNKIKVRLVSAILFLLIVNRVFSTEIIIVPSGTSDDADLIQTTLDGLQNGDSLRLNGDFVMGRTIYLPSHFTWILDGTLTLGDNAVLEEIGYVDSTRNIDATRPTGISETPGGATNIDMSGGTYYGNSANYPHSMRFLNFVSVTNSKFHDMHITEVTDDNFTLGPGSNHNECRNIIGSLAKTGTAMADKGDHNKWYDCISEDCGSDGWAIKCHYSEFYRCIGRRNDAPGFGMFCRVDGSGNPDLGENIDNNKFIDCEAYDNNASGFSFNISSTCGEGGTIRNNYVQAVCYNNSESGVRFRNKQPNSFVENNEINIVCFGNKGLKKSGGSSSNAGGLGSEGSTTSPVTSITGSIVCVDNKDWDVNTYKATDCNITVYRPTGENAPILKNQFQSNTITVVSFDCSDQLNEWCQQKYCEILALTPPVDPDGLGANTVSFRQINLSWTDNASDEAGYKIERKSTGQYTEIATVAADVTSYNDIGLTASTTYTYRVRSYSIAGYSGYSNEASATTESGGGDSLVEIIYDDFEGDTYGNWNDGGADCKVDSTEHAHQGFYSINLESNTSTSLVTTDDLVLTGYTDVLVEFWYKAVSMETDEDFWLQISTDGGSNYTTVQKWISGVDFENDTFYSDSVAITGYTLTNQTRLRFRCDAGDDDDDVYLDEIRVSAGSGGVSAIDGANSSNPNRFVLHQNYPNPFNPVTRIEFAISTNSHVCLSVYNLLGKEVAVLVNEKRAAGSYSVKFDGSALANGIYFYRLETQNKVLTKKLTLLK